MTNEDLAEYYANLLILQYRQKTKAFDTVYNLALMAIVDQLPLQIDNAFELGTAIGAQLDVLGKYVGVSRHGNGFQGPITLDDDDFTILIKIAILSNSSGSSMAEIQALFALFFPGQVLITDYDGQYPQNMVISYLISSEVGSQDLIQLLVTGNHLPKPMGVLLSAVVYAPLIFDFFGFRTYSVNTPHNSPLNSYGDYQDERPWLSYTNAV